MMNITDLMAHSFKNFHAKGLDYVCLKRTPEHTIKAYFLDGDASKVPEVVNPHDHRYAFKTRVLCGEMIDHRYSCGGDTEVYQAFDYMTPLNGGNGFTYRGDEFLSHDIGIRLRTGAELYTGSNHRHTIQMCADQTVLLLEQFSDVVPLHVPTSCWVKRGYPAPNTSGLYERFTESDFALRLEVLRKLCGGALLV